MRKNNVTLYLGNAGRRVKTPFMNREIKGCSPILQYPSMESMVDSADRAVFKQLYPKPLLYN